MILQKLEPGRLFTFTSPSPRLVETIEAEGPRVYFPCGLRRRGAGRAYRPAPQQEILAQIVEAEVLSEQNHNRAALVLGRAASEAIARMLDPDFPSSGSRTMRQAVELLEYLGRLRFEQAQELRRLSLLRERVVHGDFQTSVGSNEVEPVLKAARAALGIS